MAKQKKPNQNILIEYTAWIFKWIFKIILFLAILGALAYGGNYLKKEYDKSQRLKARDCLAKEIPIYEKGIKDFSDSIKPSSSLKDIVDMVFYQETFIHNSGAGTGYGLKKRYLNSVVNSDDAKNKKKHEKTQKKLLGTYEAVEKIRYERIQVTDSNIKENVLVYLLKPKCDSDFDFLINITDNEDRSLDTFRVWAQNAPLGYENGVKHKFYRDFNSERKQIIKKKKKDKFTILKKKLDKKQEKINARKTIKKEHEALQKRTEQKRLSDPTRFCENKFVFSYDANGNRYCRHKDTGESMLINLKENRLEPLKNRVKTFKPKEKGGYVPEKGPVHQF